MVSSKGAGLSALLLLAVVALCTGAVPRHAICHLQPNPGSTLNVVGTVEFYQNGPSAYIQIFVNVTGLPTISPGDENRHGFHVHEIGDVSTGCAAALGHYNPFNVNHGGPDDAVRHPGDFGNLPQNCDGTLVTSFEDKRASLYGSESIYGRSIVLHAGVDDLGKGNNAASLTNGNAGARLACCSIVWTSG